MQEIIKKILFQIFSDGKTLSWFRITATLVIIICLPLLVYCLLNKYNEGAYICSGLISMCLVGKVGQSFSERSPPEGNQ